jgi:Tol biopolymer transport system component
MQVTAEPADVEYYDVNQNDGRIVYISNNQMLLINADGSGRTLLLYSGSTDVNNPFLVDIQSAVWSPNGETIAYGFGGLNLYAVGTGVTNRMMDNQTREMEGGMIFPDELYWPDRFSPDGEKLLITLGYYESASAAIYYPASDSLVRLSGDEGALICCGEEEWSQDGTTFFAANPSMGMFNSGLWRIDAASGQVTTLIPGDPGNGTYNYADAPFLGPDNQLYFFFASTPASGESFMDTPLQLVRSATDGVSGRTLLLPDLFTRMNEALWSPDANFVIVAIPQNDQTYQGGQLEIVYVDGRPRAVLVPFGRDMKWGP